MVYASLDANSAQWARRSHQPPGLLHAIGGFGVTEPLTTHEVYEPANDAWSTAAPLPTARGALATITGADGLIYAIGGFDGNNPVATVDAYDPTSDKWIAKAPLNAARMWLAAIAGPGGLIYAIGGGGATEAILNSMEAFNVASDTWATSSVTLPAATCGLAAAVDPNGMIYVIGGDSAVNNVVAASANVYIYDPAAPGWTSQPSLSSARAVLAATTGPDGLIYAIGGGDGTNAVATVEAFAYDKCYPIEHQIAVLGSELSTLESGLQEIPPQARAGAEKELAALRGQLISLEGQLKKCRGQ